jgi:phage terminase small subunit
MSNRNEHGLTPQQERFAQEIGAGRSGVEAYRTAYPKAKAWKEQSVHVEASKMLAKPKVSQRVSKIQAAGAKMAELDAAEIAQEIKRVALSDIAGIMNTNGTVKLPHELDPATRAAVASFKIDEFGRIEYKFWDKNSALERGAKILGMFEKDNKQKADPIKELLQSLGGNVVGPVANPLTGAPVEED